MLAFITNLNLTELTIIVVGAVLVFGKDLPRVVMRGLQHLAKLRKAVTQMWNEAGLEQEMRKVRAEIDSEIPKVSNPSQWIAEGKRKLADPVETWRRNVQSEIEGSVPANTKKSASPKNESAESLSGEAPEPHAETLEASEPHSESGEPTGEGSGAGSPPGFKPGPAPTAPVQKANKPETPEQ